MIDLNKKYKLRNGLKARVLCVDSENRNYPVVALVQDAEGGPIARTSVFTQNGSYYHDGLLDRNDLLEVDPYDDFKIDDPVMVRNSGLSAWVPRYFSGVNSIGQPSAWMNGATSWNGIGKAGWDECRRPTAEELNRA